MKTRTEDAYQEYMAKQLKATKGESEGRFLMSICHEVKDSFIAGAEFMQKEAEFWETFVKGLTKDLSFHQNLNKEKFEEIEKLKAQNEIMREALEYMKTYKHPDYFSHSRGSIFDVINESLKKVGEV